MDKRLHLLFSKKSGLGIAKIYWGITLTSIAAKICNALLLNYIEAEIEKILGKNQNVFQRNWSTTSLFLTIHWIIEGVCAKSFELTFICQFLQGIWLHTQREMEQTLLAYSLTEETVKAMMMLYKNKVKDHSPNGDTDFLDIFAWVLNICS